MRTIGILNGPNLGRLGKREPTRYGTKTLAELETLLQKEATALGVAIRCKQANGEGELISQIECWTDDNMAGLIINPAAYTHSSLALHDAIAGTALPTIEVHITNLYQRDNRRHHSYTAPACLGVISGLGLMGYSLALRYLAQQHHASSSTLSSELL